MRMVMPAIGNYRAIPDMDDKTRAGQGKQQAPGAGVLRNHMLEHAINMIEPANKDVQAAVDGEPVYSYVPDVSTDENEWA